MSGVFIYLQDSETSYKLEELSCMNDVFLRLDNGTSYKNNITNYKLEELSNKFE